MSNPGSYTKEGQQENLVRHIVQYINRGWKVFPCKPNKTPYTANGFHDATDDLEQVIDWWSARPTALIGVPTGPGPGSGSLMST